MTAIETARLADGGRDHAWTELVRPRWALPVAVVAAAGAASVVLAGNVLLWPGWFAVFCAYNILAFTVAGLLWLRLRPRGGVGYLLLALGVIVALQSLQGASSSLPFSIGVLA